MGHSGRLARPGMGPGWPGHELIGPVPARPCYQAVPCCLSYRVLGPSTSPQAHFCAGPPRKARNSVVPVPSAARTLDGGCRPLATALAAAAYARRARIPRPCLPPPATPPAGEAKKERKGLSSEGREGNR
jgi:hypothetical protein